MVGEQPPLNKSVIYIVINNRHDGKRDRRYGPGGFSEHNLDLIPEEGVSDWDDVNELFCSKVVDFNTFLFEKIKDLEDKHIFFVPMQGFHDEPTEWLNEERGNPNC